MLLILTTAAAADDVLATNSWTAAFVEMSGGEAVQLAPSSMTHPPEYELKPSDVKKVRDADYLVYAGYEVLMKTVFYSFGKPEETLIKIFTSYSPEVLEKSVLLIAERLGTTAEAELRIAEYNDRISAARGQLKAAGLFGQPVLVHFHQKPLADALGFEIKGVFGPQPLEVKQIAEMAKADVTLIFDNAHNPMAAPLEEILAIDAVELVNFPGFPLEDGSTVPETLTEVMEYNVNKMLQ